MSEIGKGQSVNPPFVITMRVTDTHPAPGQTDMTSIISTASASSSLISLAGVPGLMATEALMPVALISRTTLSGSSVASR